MSLPQPLRIGYFGKVPNHGDFIARSVSRDVRNCLDRWLADSMEASRTTLQEGWLHIYLTSPIWRFVLRGVFDETKLVAGVIIPSVDRINRHFPFVVCAEFSDLDLLDSTKMLPEIDALLDSLEQFALRGLSDAFDREVFDYDLTYFTKSVTKSNTKRPASISELLDEPSSQTSFSQIGINNSHNAIFWTEGSDLRSAGMKAYHDLPPLSEFVTFLRDENIFSDFENIWMQTRDITASRSDNGVCALEVSEDQFFQVVMECRSVLPDDPNTGFGAASAATQSMVLSNGRFLAKQDASIGRFIARAVLDAENNAPEDVIGRICAYLRCRFPNTPAAVTSSQIGIACALKPDDDYIDVICSPDFACIATQNNEMRWVFGRNQSEDAATLRLSVDGMPPIARLGLDSVDRLFFFSASNIPSDLETLVSKTTEPLSIRLLEKVNQDRVLEGATQSPIAAAIVDYSGAKTTIRTADASEL